MIEALDWSNGWLKEGYYVSYYREGVLYFEHIIQRDFGHWEYDWPETITSLSTSGPFVPDDLEITRGYDENSNTNHIWQMIFGIKGQPYIYIELPTDSHRHGIPKVPKPSTTMRRVSHYEEWMSPFREPSFITEHFMMRPDTLQIAFDAYNPHSIDLPDVVLNIFLNKIVTERVGEASNGVPKPAQKKDGTPIERFRDVVEKLYRQAIPCTPLSILPVRAPAEAPGGQ